MAETTKEYEMLYNLVTTRMSVRKFKPDPIPDGYEATVPTHSSSRGVSTEKK